MTAISNRLQKNGFVTILGRNNSGDCLDVLLSAEDAKVVLGEYKKGGVKLADSIISKFGRLLLGKLGSVSKTCTIDGYWVDNKTHKIAVRLVKKADDGGAKEKVTKISETESINNDFTALHDSMVTMRTKPSGTGDADLTEKTTKVRESSVEKKPAEKNATKKTAEDLSVEDAGMPGPDMGSEPMSMPVKTEPIPTGEGAMGDSIKAFEEVEKNFTTYLSESVPVDRAVEIATDIYEQIGGSGKAEEKKEPEPKAEKKEEKAEKKEEGAVGEATK
jgi:hypothetical protein